MVRETHKLVRERRVAGRAQRGHGEVGRFLPDGERFLFLARGIERDDNTIFVGSLSGDEPVELMRSTNQAEPAADGYLLFAQDESILARPFDFDELESVLLVRDFLQAPERYLRMIWDEPE